MDNITQQLPFIIKNSWVILLLPFLSFVINGVFLCHKEKNHRLCAYTSIALTAGAWLWVCGVVAWYFTNILGNPEAFPNRTMIAWSMDWMPINSDLIARMGFYMDPISVMMTFVVSTIGLLVNIYSVGYMKGDSGKGRFFSLLSFFVFSMLGMVMSSNILQMFVFWELVGLSSYSLIGFWYQKPSAVAASKKAFIVTRFADAFFLIGIVAVTYVSKSFDFINLNSPETIERLKSTIELGFFSSVALNVGTLLIFAGGWGKSAMFPLHIWLPDAMEGPTPVSAIIHSATMVVAGVYLTARMFPMFVAAEYTLTVITYVGAFTALFAAVIACTQRDIKRILAFSTLSQLGYMIFSLGVASIDSQANTSAGFNPLGYSASMYHVFNHAFFKCMLFLGAGSIIHSVRSNDIDKMGGLRKKMPFTYFSLGAACLSIAGIPPLSGFFSKDEIILTAFQSGHTEIGIIGLLVGGLTSFYMFRFFFLTFHGEARSDLSHAHEDKWMTIPIVFLTIPTIFGGLLANVFSQNVLPPMVLPTEHFEHITWLPILAGTIGVLGMIIALKMYGLKSSNISKAIEFENRPVWYKIIYDKFYIDEIYLWVTHKIIFNTFSKGLQWIDTNIADGWVNLTGFTCRVGSFVVRQLQNGHIPVYLTAMIFGIFMIYFLGQLPL